MQGLPYIHQNHEKEKTPELQKRKKPSKIKKQLIQAQIILFVGKWMELENIKLSQVRQVQKVKACVFSLIYGS
jgi:hypothetical protein